jgi:hypothetical protein
MLLRELYINSHTILSKDGNEGLITMDRWNTLLQSLNHEFIRTKLEEIFGAFPNGNVTDETIYSSKLIQSLIATDMLSVTAGVIDLGSTPTLMYWGKMRTTSTYNGKVRKVELVSDSELNGRLTNMMQKSLSEYPAARIKGNYIYIYPTDISSVVFDYVKIPTVPFLDYYVDAKHKTQFLGAGSTYTLQANEVYRDHSTSGTKTSLTVELQLPVNMHSAFQDYIIEKLSLMISDQYINQFTIAKEAKEEAR